MEAGQRGLSICYLSSSLGLRSASQDTVKDKAETGSDEPGQGETLEDDANPGDLSLETDWGLRQNKEVENDPEESVLT